MCEFWGCLVTRGGRVVWDKDTSSHEDLIKQAGLHDVKLEDRDFVRIEVTPKTIWSKDLKDWEYKVDEKGTLPVWYKAEPDKYEKLVWAEWRKAMAQTLWKLNVARIPQIVKEIKAIKYFKVNAPPEKSWKVFYAPTLDAAVSAARSAARSAAGSAAGSAAWSAAWSASGSAAWDAEVYAQVKIIPRVPKKHVKYMEERMLAWKRGYGVYCDVNGVLYCYAIKPFKPKKKKGGVKK